ncbi:MAG: hypothetical protein ACKOAS_07530 [Verrucomicrobiota bacterium]
MNISSSSSAAAFQEAARQRSVEQSRQVRQEAAQQTSEAAQAVKVRNRQAVQQAAAAPSGGNKISQDIRQMADRESRREVEANRENRLRQTAEQMAVKFREMARRSESARRVGNSEREGFSATA